MSEYINSEQDYQNSVKREREFSGYCNKIKKALDEDIAGNCEDGERAIWELIQNACDLSSDARIKMELFDDSFVFTHHGTPFDYASFFSLVKQDSSKDQTEAQTVGRYGTGFMTTHTFNRVVEVSGPYAIKENKDTISGYVRINKFRLDRSQVDTPEGPQMMGQQIDEVENFRTLPDRQTTISDDSTSFRYSLQDEHLAKVSGQLEKAARLMPFVLSINDRIREVEILNHYNNTHLVLKKEPADGQPGAGWNETHEIVTLLNPQNGARFELKINSLKSDKGDVIFIPPFPDFCGSVKDIPSLFLWYPLLGTESFGVNFIFHSRRFYPVEQRNNIMIPDTTEASIKHGGENLEILKEMMVAVFNHYSDDEHAKTLTREFCEVNFPTGCKPVVKQAFYDELQLLWAKHIPTWKVIPVGEELCRMNDPAVKLLHTDFYQSLKPEDLEKYQAVLLEYARLPKYSGEDSYKMPKKDLIGWSQTINAWRCNRDSEFFLTPGDVCRSIVSGSENLLDFLEILKANAKIYLADSYKIIPNREGSLRLRTDLRHADFMTQDVFDLVKCVMGNKKSYMLDPRFKEVCSFTPYSQEELKQDITFEIGNLSRDILVPGKEIDNNKLSDLIKFCSAFHLNIPNNRRSKLMPHIASFFGETYRQTMTIRFLDEEKGKDEETFYEPVFNFLIDYTLSRVSRKSPTWVSENKEWLIRFITDYAPKSSEERRKKMYDYAVIPNQCGILCKIGELRKNSGVDDTLAGYYDDVFDLTEIEINTDTDNNEDKKRRVSILRSRWMDNAFEEIVDAPEEDTPKKIAKEIEDALVNDMRQEDKTKRKFTKTVRQIILEFNKDTGKVWSEWFRQIFDKRAEYIFSMKEGDEQESLFKIMDLDGTQLKQLADMSQTPNFQAIFDNSEQINELLQLNEQQITAFHEIVKRFPTIDFNSILQKLIEEQGDFAMDRFQQSITDERKTEIGDKGECFVYEYLLAHFPYAEITWSNYAPNDPSARIVSFRGKSYRLRTTSHSFDFIIKHNDREIYIEVKTTTGRVHDCSKDFPLIFEPKEWEWIDLNTNEKAAHFIVRVFDIEGAPRAYFLKQSLAID